MHTSVNYLTGLKAVIRETCFVITNVWLLNMRDDVLTLQSCAHLH